MGKYMIKRILIAIPVLIGITIIDYAIAQLTGGAPAYDAKMQQVVVEQKWR